MNNQRMKWDAEAAFKRIEHDSKIYAQEPGQGERASRFLHGKQPHRFGWTPAPTKPAYSQTNVNAHLEHKGRDYEALTKAALRKPVGYWEDAPRGPKFNQDIDFIEPNPPSKELREAYNQALKLFEAKIEAAVAAPTTTPQSADGPWPKCLLSNCGTGVIVYADDGDDGTFCGTRGWRWKFSKRYTAALTEIQPPMLKKREPLLIADAIRRLEQNGHADVAAQLRGKGAADGLFEPVGTMPVVGDRFNYGGEVCTVTRIDHTREFAVRFLRCEASHEDGLKISYFTDKDKNPLRILKRPTKPRDDVATGARVWADEGFVWVQLAGVMYGCAPGKCAWGRTSDLKPEWELHGAVRDAIIAECCAAMKLDLKTGEPINK